MNPKTLRLKLGLNQTEFWGAIGWSQSGGSRFENGRRVPKPVMTCLRLRWSDNEIVQAIFEEAYHAITYDKFTHKQ